ncbi:MAG: hypothetical protein HP491_01010, partial [Nitrospira sp.]|nr:hypothetical protein [Nitrospira sp.]
MNSDSDHVLGLSPSGGAYDDTPPQLPLKRSTSGLRRRALDRLAQIIVTLGGTAVILSIIGMFVFLIKEVVPLFLSPHGTQSGHVAGDPDRGAPSQASLVGLDEYQEIIYLLSGGAQRHVRFFNAQSGAPIAVELPAGLADVNVVSIARAAGSGNRFAFATSDGRLIPVTIEFTSSFDQGERRVTPTITLGSPMQASPATERILRLAYQPTDHGLLTAALTDQGHLWYTTESSGPSPV